ncbi:hypothetical protein J3R30DRAFT_3284324, partial [Lentinula aciculospora]
KQKQEHEKHEKHETQWKILSTSSSTHSIGFSDIPWPVYGKVKSLEDITPREITAFVFGNRNQTQNRTGTRNQTRALDSSPSRALTEKQTLLTAQLRWHPDRFQRILNKVRVEEKELVQNGVGAVTRCLNDLLDKENQKIRMRSGNQS